MPSFNQTARNHVRQLKLPSFPLSPLPKSGLPNSIPASELWAGKNTTKDTAKKTVNDDDATHGYSCYSYSQVEQCSASAAAHSWTMAKKDAKACVNGAFEFVQWVYSAILLSFIQTRPTPDLIAFASHLICGGTPDRVSTPWLWCSVGDQVQVQWQNWHLAKFKWFSFGGFSHRKQCMSYNWDVNPGPTMTTYNGSRTNKTGCWSSGTDILRLIFDSWIGSCFIRFTHMSRPVPWTPGFWYPMDYWTKVKRSGINELVLNGSNGLD